MIDKSSLLKSQGSLYLEFIPKDGLFPKMLLLSLMGFLTGWCNLKIVGDLNTTLTQTDVLTNKWYTNKPYNKHSAILYDFMDFNHLCVADFMFDQKVSYTFKRGSVCSYIDHVLIPDYLCEMINNCSILCATSENVSDHLALSTQICIPVSNKSLLDTSDKHQSQNFPKPIWHDDTFKSIYSELVSCSIDTIPITLLEHITTKDALKYVNELYTDICDKMHACVSKCRELVHTRFRQKTKKWWNRIVLLPATETNYFTSYGNAQVVLLQELCMTVVTRMPEKHTESAVA